MPGYSSTCINWLVCMKSYKFKPSVLIIKTSCLMEHTWWVISICIYHFAGQFWEDFQRKCGTSGFEVGMSCCEVQLTFQRGDGILQQQLQSWSSWSIQENTYHEFQNYIFISTQFHQFFLHDFSPCNLLMLRKISGRKMDKVTEDWRRLHNDEIHVICTYQQILSG